MVDFLVASRNEAGSADKELVEDDGSRKGLPEVRIYDAFMMFNERQRIGLGFGNRRQSYIQV